MTDSLYLYCIIDADTQALRPCLGLMGQPVSLIKHSQLGLVVSTVSSAQLTELKEKLPFAVKNKQASFFMAHEQVIEQQMELGTVLPFRFLSLLRDRLQVQTFLSTNASHFTQQLACVQGKHEFSLKLLYPPNASAPSYTLASPPITPDTKGKQYLYQKWKHFKEQDHQQSLYQPMVKAFTDRLHSYCTHMKEKSLPSHSFLFNGTFLVAKENRSVFQTAFHELKTQYSKVPALLSGPWPPYNFITPVPLSEN